MSRPAIRPSRPSTSMTSDKQREANRRNAQRSTGPRTAKGKSVSSSNAMRHGLSAGLGEHPSQNLRIELLAKAIAGPEATADELFYARIAAEATLQIERIRLWRTTMLSPSVRKREVLSASFPRRLSWERSSKTALDAKLIADEAARDHGDGTTEEERLFMLTFPLKRCAPMPSGPEAEIEILHRLMPKVAVLDRYETRELRRRRAACCALEALHSSKTRKSAWDRHTAD